MKKVEHGRIRIRLKERNIRLTGKALDLADHSWMFTVDEKKEIRFVLNKQVPKENIEAFINHLEPICAIKKALIDQATREDLRDKHKRVLADFKAVLKHMQKIDSGRMILWREYSVTNFGDVTPRERSSPLSLWDCIEPIKDYIKLLEERPAEKKKPGREPADSDHFIRNIKDLYIKHIGKNPTVYINGRFYRVVAKVLEILGLPHTDPSKSIRAALKEV